MPPLSSLLRLNEFPLNNVNGYISYYQSVIGIIYSVQRDNKAVPNQSFSGRKAHEKNYNKLRINFGHNVVTKKSIKSNRIQGVVVFVYQGEKQIKMNGKYSA